MTGRRRLSYPQTQALALLGQQRAKIAGFKAEFEARKAAEYAEAVSDMVEEQAQIVANLLDMGTPKIRIAEVMGTKNYGNLQALDAIASKYRTEAPAQEKPAEVAPVDEDLVAKEIRGVLDYLDHFTKTVTTPPNEHGEWEETWELDGVALTVLCWDEGRNLLFVEGPSDDAARTLENDHNDYILEHLYAES